MAERLFGLETEYAFTALDSAGKALARDQILHGFMQLARNELPHLRDAGSSGMYLQNGSRLYVDCGSHPELCTPECTTPWDAVRYVLAGEQILARLAVKLEETETNLSQALFFKCNVDYSGTRSTWGCHESYLHRADPNMLPDQVVPHLVSRIVYTGAGGFNSVSPGLEFTLSPRVPHLTEEVSGGSTHDRGIFHAKNESLAGGGYHRMHILCGESLGSELAAWLKVGTTALVVAMVDAGLRPGDSVGLVRPLEAMRRFATDTECKVKVKGKGGQPLTAIGIQRRYLTHAESHVHDTFMPSWAEEVCREWRKVLDRLESGPFSGETALDWGIKLAIFRDRVRRCGMTWDSLSHWTKILLALKGTLRETVHSGKPLTTEFIFGKESPVATEVKQLLKAKGLKEDDLSQFLDLRQELFEIDTRFGQLGENGIFSALNRAGLLTHHVAGVENIEVAVVRPPVTGRARLRGECVRRLAGTNSDLVCDWDGIWDEQQKRALDLSDPFETQERWVSWPKNKGEPTAAGHSVLARLWRVQQDLRTRLRS